MRKKLKTKQNNDLDPVLWPRWWAVCLNSRHRNTNVHKLKCVWGTVRVEASRRWGWGAEKRRARVRARERERDLLSHLSRCTLYCPFSICSSTAAVALHLRGQRVCKKRGIAAVKHPWHPPFTVLLSKHRSFKRLRAASTPRVNKRV